MNKKKMITGITSSGKMTLGNYLGVVKRLIQLQRDYDLLVFVANLHAITVSQDPQKLKTNTLEIVALYMAAGLDPEQATIFVQSEVPAHSQLAWILNTQTYMGELARMTQFKDKSQKQTNKESIPAGLFNYPTLMAADILLYNADYVPVGVDQKQHVEITKTLAMRFNKKYGAVFTVPEVLLTKDLVKIMDLQNPSKKMSKSTDNPKAIIYVLDDAETVTKKIRAALTDGENLIKYDPVNKPGVSNLMNIYCLLMDIKISDAEKKWEGKNYGDLKNDVAAAISETLTPIQERYYQLVNSKELKRQIVKGNEKANKFANETIAKINNVLGLKMV